MITQADVSAAAKRISDHIRTTPIVTVGAEVLHAPVVLKLEQLQHTGAFKVRGALNAMLTAAEQGSLPDSGVIAASGGNHGMAIAYAARVLGIAAEIFVPTTTPQLKVERLRDYGATVRQIGTEYADALAAASQRKHETGALAVHAFDQLEVIAGQGTAVLELLDAAGPVDTVLVAVGGGGLSAGAVAALAGQARVVGVEPYGAATLRSALDAGAPVDVPITSFAADALGARRLGELPFQVLSTAHEQQLLDSVLVSDDDIRAAQHVLWDQLRVVVEPGGATAAAALLSGAYWPIEGERIAIVICGANTAISFG